MMWASLLLAGFLSGWWGALALAAAPPANRNSLGETSTRGTRHRVPSEPSMTAEVEDIRRNHIISPTVALPPPFLALGTREIDGINDLNLPTSTVDRLKNLAITENQGLSYRHDFDRSNPLWPLSRESSSSDHYVTTYQVTPASFESIQKSMIDPFENRFEEAGSEEDVINEDDSEEDEKVADLIRDAFLTSSRRTDDPPPLPPIDRNFHRYPKMEESSLTRAPRHSSSRIAVFPYPFGTTESPSVVERPRAIRSATVGGNQRKQNRPKNRTRADSPREQRRRCKNKGGCRGQNWCPDVDVGNRAYLAPTVFEGKARSMSSRKSGANYAVTFEVKQVYKSQPGFQPLQKNDSVRLHFRDKSAPGKSTVCDGNNNGNSSSKQQRDNQSGVVRANIKRGKVYLVFVNRVGPRNFTILGEPVIRSKKNEQAVQAVVRPDYVREVTLSELRDSIARLRDRVKLVCRTRGSPPPRVHWLKDGMPLYPRRGLRIQHKRRRSKVVISSAKLEDSGRYECVAESTSGHRASLAAQLLVAHDIPETTTAAWPRQEQPCPIAGDFCMNGGTCLFFETVGEPACRCAEGFTGQRCETKDVISTGSVYNRTPFSCKLGLSTSYYC